MIRAGAFLLALFLALAALPALARAEAALDAGRLGRTMIEGGRAVLAIAAASALTVWLVATR